jgi:hypothetical protein
VRNADLDNARLGVIYFLSSLRVDLSPEQSITDLKNQGVKFLKGKVGPKAGAAIERVGNAVEAVDRTVDQIAKSVKEWLCDRFDVSEIDAELVVQHLRHNLPGLIIGIQDELGKDAKDFATGGLTTIASGLYTAITRTIEFFDLKHKGKGVVMESGHPELIAASITRNVAKSALIGLGEAALAGAKAALAATTAGVGVIINKIAGLVEMILRFALRFCEARTLGKIIVNARDRWAQRNAGGLHQRPTEFADWFKDAIDRAPIVGALVMNCGIAGDSLRFLKVCMPGGTLINQNQYDQGVTYLDALKATASSFILEYQNQVRISSADKMCAALLKHAGEIGLVQKEASSGWRAQIYAWSNQGTTKSKALGWVLDKVGYKQSTARTL